MKSQTQRTLLMGFVASIAGCGLVGAYCLIDGAFGPLHARILGSTAAVAAASILGLACAVPWERRRWHPIGPMGAVFVAIALLLGLTAIWGGEWLQELRRLDEFLQYVGTACILAVAFPQVGLMSLARLRRSLEWVRVTTLMAVAVLAGQLFIVIWWEPPDADVWARFIGVVAIGVACGTIAVPILHRVSGIHRREAIRTVELFLSATCPRCESAQRLPVGRSKCTSCGLRFSIEVEEETCAQCGYSLYLLTSAVCPECGTPIARSQSISG